MLASGDGASGEPRTQLVGAVTAVLWDIDGTLITSGGVAARTFLDAVHAVCGARPDTRGLDFGGRLDPEIAALLVQAAGGRPDQVDAVLERFESLVADRRDGLRARIDVLPGVRALVAALDLVGARQTVVTGNLESVARAKLDPTGLIPPLDLSVGGFGASGADRTAVAQAALDRLRVTGWRGSPDTCWVIGDTPRDLACARALGLRCALVATGSHSLHALAELGPDLVLSSLSDQESWHGSWLAEGVS
jgi:phosphoglycolate phosphatase-like HAD superfamily hydrolase